MKEIHILNLGAGVQSTALYMMYVEQMIKTPIHCAIFADTQSEPKAVYDHLQWLRGLGNPPIWVRTRGNLGGQIKNGMNATGQRFISIPAYTKPLQINRIFKEEPAELSLDYDDGIMPDGRDDREGMIRRQCTQEFKLIVIHEAIRREILNLQKGQRIPKDVRIINVVGISLDEVGRAMRMMPRQTRNSGFKFPLIDMQMTRADCLDYLKGRVPHEVPRSACTFCPFHDDNEWADLKELYPSDFEEACQVDEALRIPGNVYNRGMDAPIYLHESCKPLREVTFTRTPKKVGAQMLLGGFWKECAGVCGV
jgi:hypothetical protein